MKVEFHDNSKEVLAAFETACLRALEKCGLTGEGFAKRLVRVDTGNLRNSVSHKVDPEEQAVYIGTNSDYGPYQEFGTGIYTEGGRQDPWVYRDDEGRYHWTRGNKAHPFLKPAVADHKGTYREIIEDEMHG